MKKPPPPTVDGAEPLPAGDASGREVSRHPDFVAQMAHELRTPLAVAEEYVTLVREGFVGEPTKEQASYLDVAINNLGYLATVIDDMLDLARRHAGEAIRVDFQPSVLADVVTEALSLLAPGGRSGGTTITNDVARTLPTLLLDPRRVKQILLNVLGNAVKFTPDGGAITISAEPLSEDVVRVDVRDTGVGIPEREQRCIFDFFKQASSSETSGLKGSGLGLAISREIVQLHGGDIGVESRVRRGSCFWFTLPVLNVSNVERVVIVPSLDRLPKQHGSLSILAVHLSPDAATLGMQWVGTLKERLRGSDIVLPLSETFAVVVAPAAARAMRAVSSRVDAIMENRNVDPGQYWMETVTFPCPGVGREDFLRDMRELFSRAR